MICVRSQKDPAVERWFQMREDMYKGFTFTRENTVPVLSLVFVVPAVIYYFFDSDLVRPLLIKHHPRSVLLERLRLADGGFRLVRGFGASTEAGLGHQDDDARHLSPAGRPTAGGSPEGPHEGDWTVRLLSGWPVSAGV